MNLNKSATGPLLRFRCDNGWIEVNGDYSFRSTVEVGIPNIMPRQEFGDDGPEHERRPLLTIELKTSDFRFVPDT